MIELTEAEVKKDVEKYLKTLMGYGKLWYSRLNAGTFGARHIKGAIPGTADLIVIQPGQVHIEYMGEQKGPVIPVAFVTFIECKATNGKQKPIQKEFESMIISMHCRYAIIRSVSELEEVLKRE